MLWVSEHECEHLVSSPVLFTFHSIHILLGSLRSICVLSKWLTTNTSQRLNKTSDSIEQKYYYTFAIHANEMCENGQQNHLTLNCSHATFENCLIGFVLLVTYIHTETEPYLSIL